MDSQTLRQPTKQHSNTLLLLQFKTFKSSILEQCSEAGAKTVPIAMQRTLRDYFNSPDSSASSPSTADGKTSLESLPSTPSSTKSPRLGLLKSSSRTPRRSPKVKRGGKSEDRFQQAILDAGQSKIGLEHCQQCGMVYNVDDKGDVERHKKFHNRFAEKKEFRVATSQIETWRRCLYSERISTPLNCYLFLFDAHSTASLKRKFEEIVKNYVNEELGFCQDLPIWDQDKRRQALVLVVRACHRDPAYIGGILLVDRVKKAMLMPKQKPFTGQFIGINRIWIHAQLRRQGIACFLLDSARRIFAPHGSPTLPKTRIAFSEPTEAGIKLAVAYLGDQENGRYIAYSLYSKAKSVGLEEEEED